MCDVCKTSLLPENILVNSPHPGKSKESDTLDCQSVSKKTFGRIDINPTYIFPITTIDDHIRSPVNLMKPSKFGSPPLQGPELVQDG